MKKTLKKAQDFGTDLKNVIAGIKDDYHFQPELTKKLDNLTGDFTENNLLEIVLWKTNRYPGVSIEILELINQIRQNYSEEKARILLYKLISLKGFDLPMASTVLRFACPNELQIIDKRVYRIISPEIEELKIPHKIDEKVNFYFQYIADLKSLCSKYDIPFEKSDRLLYQLDKTVNSQIPINY